MLLRCLLLGLLCLSGATPATAVRERPSPRPSPSAAALGFDRFVRAASPVCQRQPAAGCVDAGFRFADSDGDHKLSLGELQQARAGLQDWMLWKRSHLTAEERGAISLGLALVDAIGLAKLMASYDADDDGVLAKPELLADIRLDERPLGEVLLDPDALDREAVARRLGALAPLLDGYYRNGRYTPGDAATARRSRTRTS